MDSVGILRQTVEYFTVLYHCVSLRFDGLQGLRRDEKQSMFPLHLTRNATRKQKAIIM